MVIWVDCFVLLEHGFLGKKVGADVLMDVVVEFVVVKGLDVVQAGFFVTFWRCCLVDIMGVRLVMEVVVGAVVLVVLWSWCEGDGLWFEIGCGSWRCKKWRRGCGD